MKNIDKKKSPLFPIHNLQFQSRFLKPFTEKQHFRLIVTIVWNTKFCQVVLCCFIIWLQCFGACWARHFVAVALDVSILSRQRVFQICLFQFVFPTFSNLLCQYFSNICHVSFPTCFGWLNDVRDFDRASRCEVMAASTEASESGPSPRELKEKWAEAWQVAETTYAGEK